MVTAEPGERARGTMSRIVWELKPGAGVDREAANDLLAQGAEGLRVFMNNPPSINIGGLAGNADYTIVVQGADLKVLYPEAQEFEARLRQADEDPASGVLQELERIVTKLKSAWPGVRIIVRGDSGFCREEIMSYCEGESQIEYVLGLAKNSRLIKQIDTEMAQAKQIHQSTQKSARVFKDFRYRTRKSWSCERRVVGKAEYLAKGENPRFIVTSIASADKEARELYEDFYCARGDMENRIKEQQLGLFAYRTST